MKRENRHIIEGTFQSNYEGAPIYYCHDTPVTKSEDHFHLIFQHGAIEYHQNYFEFFDYLKHRFEDRISISYMDLYGHGLSGGSRAYIDHFDSYIYDALNFFHIVKSIESQDNTRFIIGAHSLGAMIFLTTLINQKNQIPFNVERLILTNPCIKPHLELPSSLVQKISKYSQYLKKIRLPSLYGAKDLTSDNKKIEQFEQDVLNSHFMTLNMGLEILAQSLKMKSLSYFLKVPTLFLLSDNDRIVDSQATDLFITGVDKSLKHVKKYKDTKHDLLNEVLRKKVYNDITDYIEGRYD